MDLLKQNLSSIRFYQACTGIFILLSLTIACTDPVSLPYVTTEHAGIIRGQVYNLSHPGPIPIGWIPPPYEAVCTVIAQDIQQVINLEVKTDSHGKFQILVPLGTYYLRVKESRLSSVTGPYSISEGEILDVKAYFDNGAR